MISSIPSSHKFMVRVDESSKDLGARKAVDVLNFFSTRLSTGSEYRCLRCHNQKSLSNLPSVLLKYQWT